MVYFPAASRKEEKPRMIESSSKISTEVETPLDEVLDLSVLSMIELEESGVTVLIDKRKHQNSHYSLLGLGYSESLSELKKGCKSLLMQNHPDKFTHCHVAVLEEKQRQTASLLEAKAAFKDEESRKQYDAQLGHVILDEASAWKTLIQVYSDVFIFMLEREYRTLDGMINEEMICRHFFSTGSQDEHVVQDLKFRNLVSMDMHKGLSSEEVREGLGVLSEKLYGHLVAKLDGLISTSESGLKGALSMLAAANVAHGLLDIDQGEQGVETIRESLVEEFLSKAQASWIQRAKLRFAKQHFLKVVRSREFELRDSGFVRREGNMLLRSLHKRGDGSPMPEPSREQSKFREAREVEELCTKDS